MSIQYFYNFCLKQFDNTDLSGDLLSAVRKSFFRHGVRIRDRITGSSDDQPLYYDLLIEKDKPMKWTVRTADGKTVQEVRPSDNNKYFIYFYHNQALFKRLLFSKHHTLLKIEYFDSISGEVRHTLEPRKAMNSLCILYTVKTSAKPIPLFEEPGVLNDEVRSRMQEEFTDYTVAASTDKGIIRFLSEEQLSHYNSVKEKYEQELAAREEESFVDGDTPLLDKIKAKDFNVKRNLSSALDITLAMEFGYHEENEESPAEPTTVQEFLPYIPSEEDDYEDTVLVDGGSDEPRDIIFDPAYEAQTVAEPVYQPEEQIASEPVYQPEEQVTPEPAYQAAEQVAPEPAYQAQEQVAPEPVYQPQEQVASEPVYQPEPYYVPDAAVSKPGTEPDKQIMADGAIYSYYGDLDAQGNRNGFGRTMTDEGHTAYEGHYYNDKRSGNGSYFYKNGTLCYTGDWMENVRHGVGVGVSSRDGSIHVGNWKNNKPDGNGVRLTADGDIRFVCKELVDGTTVLMHYMPDDSVIISKYDKYGMKLGDTSVSLKDLPLS